ncbi:cyclin-t2 [Plakobranchus ocellatus]|uniref:Cyclin-t2 n=1 Tax=Plakobranchus ocellatus TaxID=259542 RepID=A0AAV4AVQ0_9GAST|nr:cyclin-t2 [Plakobranchus ocellatus]
MEESIQDFKWLFPDEKLHNTPSVRMGISPEKELTFRQKEAILIQSIGSKAHLTQLAVKTSVVFMHRFFMYRSVTYYPRVQMAIAFALAGGKVEESDSARKLEHLIRATIEVLCANKNREFLDKSDPFTYEMDCQLKPKINALKESKCSTDSADYLEMRKLILECETEIYSVIGFQLQIVHPHNFVLRMSSLLGAESIKDITQYAYNLATASSQLTMLCLKYKPETIATMCLNVAFKANAVQLTSLKDSKVKWYQVYDAGTDYKEIEAVSEEFLHLLKGCPLLPTWMGMLSRISKRGLSGPVRGPGTYQNSRQQASSASSAPAKIGPGNTSNNHSLTAQAQSSKYSSLSSQAGSLTGTLDSSQHRPSQKDGRPPASSASRPPYSSSSRPQDHRQSSSASAQSQGDAQSSSVRASQVPPSSSSSNISSRNPQENSKHSSRGITSEDMSRSWEDQHRSYPSKADSVRQKDSSACGNQQQHPVKSRMSDPAISRVAVEDNASSPDVKPFNVNSPVAVRPPSPPFPPPANADMEEDVSGSDNATSANMAYSPGAIKLSPPDATDSSSSHPPSAPASGSKLSLSDYRQRASAKKKELADTLNKQSRQSNVQEANFLKNNDNSHEEVKSEPVTNSPKEEQVIPAIAGYSFSKPQDSPSNPRIKIKVKRDPSSGERHAVKYAESGLKIKIKPPRSPKPEVEVDAGSEAFEQSTEFGSAREEGEILEDSPSPASSTGSSRKSESLRIRLSVPKSSDSGSNQRENDHWSSKRSTERESGHKSHHHGHHHRSHHKSKKHKEHRSSRHEGKTSSSSVHSSSKRSGSHAFDERQAKLSRTTSNNPSYTNSGGSGGFGADGILSSPPLPAPPPPPHRTLQHQSSGFSIYDAFTTSLPPGHDSVSELEEDHNLSAPTTPLDAIPPHHEPFHRMLEEHRAMWQAERPPLPPVPPPPPPPSAPPPPPPPAN